MVKVAEKLLCVVVMLLCHPSAAFASETSTGDSVAEAALLNAIHSQELKKIMRRLDMLAYENEYTELELESMRVSQINRLIEFTDKLVTTADRLPQITDQSLSNEDRITFKAIARQLNSDTVKLKEEAATGNYHNMSTRYKKLRRTCNSCHRLFREEK